MNTMLFGRLNNKNMELPGYLSTEDTLQLFAGANINYVADMLAIANVWQEGAFKEREFFTTMAKLIIDKYPDMIFQTLNDAILNGIAGNYEDGQYVGLNSYTIFRWIKCHIAKTTSNLK